MIKVFSLMEFVPVHKFGDVVNSREDTRASIVSINEVSRQSPMCISENIFPDSDIPDIYYEGAVQQVLVNRYERNPIARQKCIEHNKCKCFVCEMDFEEKYGELGKGFIHVHHVVPIHEIGEEYEIDYINDLIPVCPNCHAMLHRTVNGRRCSWEELKDILQRKMTLASKCLAGEG